MTIRGPRLLGPRAAAAAALVVALGSTACSEPAPTMTQASAAPSAGPRTERPTPAPTPSPSPTPAPTPRFTNAADPELMALFPANVAGVPLEVPPVSEYGLTPGDVGLVYGEVGVRFESLAIAYMEQPRLTAFALRVEGEPVTTEDLEPHLATAGRYVGIAGLDPEPWRLTEVGGNLVWHRPGDVATPGAQLYTWASGQFVFLLIGSDDVVNRALVAALPGEPAPSPTPVPSASDG